MYNSDDTIVIIPCTISTLWTVEIVMRVICTAFSIGLLVTAAIGLRAIGPVEDATNEHGIDFEDADSYRGAAGWLVFVGSAVTLYHVITIITIVVSLIYCRSAFKTRMYIKSLYAIINGVLCILFVLSLLAGGIVNAVYASDNNALFNEICTFEFAIPTESCEDFERVVATEAASAAESFFLVIIFTLLILALWQIGKFKKEEPEPVRSSCVTVRTSTDASPYQFVSSTDLSSFPPQNEPSRVQASSAASQSMSSYVPPSAPHSKTSNAGSHAHPSVSANVPYSLSSHVSLSAPHSVSTYVSPSVPSYPSTNPSEQLRTSPPPYEIAVALTHAQKDSKTDTTS